LEKFVGVQVGAADRIQRDVELSHESDDVDEQAHVRAVDAESGLEGELVQGMTVGSPVSWLVNRGAVRKGAVCCLPGRAEADMSQSDTAVDEEDGKTRQGQEPIEDHSAFGRQVDKCQAAEEKLENDDSHRTAFPVDVGQEIRSHACIRSQRRKGLWNRARTICSESLNCSSRAKSAGVCNAHD
jgi:hypothetical protein